MSRLIYDVGVCDGADTAFYLSLGHKVVGIEASPVMASQLRDKFAKEIADGRFILLNEGVSDATGQLEFWMSDVPEWSSFHKEIASRNGTPHRAVQVPTHLFKDVIAKYGVPYFCKIDIEGNDGLCIQGLSKETAPKYISIEMDHGVGDKHLKVLSDLGYDRFKIISQVTRAQPVRVLTWLGYVLPPKLARRLRLFVRTRLGVAVIGDWRFAHNASGAFGEQTPGPWRSYEHTLDTWRFLKAIDQRYASRGLSEWFDIHATRT